MSLDGLFDRKTVRMLASIVGVLAMLFFIAFRRRSGTPALVPYPLLVRSSDLHSMVRLAASFQAFPAQP
jgi:hypothetical protein